MRRTTVRGISEAEAAKILPFPNVRRLRIIFKGDEPKGLGYDRTAYLKACALTLKLEPVIGEGGGIVVPRERVNEIVAELVWYRPYHDQLNVMCKEYGDDEDWCGIELEDTEGWEGDNEGGLPDEDYQTFEIW